MARDDDDDDGLPPLGENTDKFLDQAKKGQSRNFLLVCKGTKVNYLAVSKKPVKKNELNDAKKAGYKGEGYFGVITGKGMELVFNLSTADGYTSEPVKDKILKDFLEEKADFKCKPTIAIVASLPAVAFDDEDLKNPLVARFLALDVRITEVLDVNPNAEAELSKTTTEIRLLLQAGEFDVAEPQIVALEARLPELLTAAPANSSSASQSTPPVSSVVESPTPSVDNDALKAKLQEALNKLVPQLKQAVVTYPDKKVELLTPVAQIKKQMDMGDLQEAKKGILAVGQLLSSLKAASIETKSEAPPNDGEGENLRTWSIVAMQKSRLLWEQTRKHVLAEIQALENQIVADVEKHNADPLTEDKYEPAEVATGATTLYGILERLDTRLIDSLDEALNAEGQARVELHKASKEIIAEYREYVETSPLMIRIDANPFFKASIRTACVAALKELSKQI